MTTGATSDLTGPATMAERPAPEEVIRLGAGEVSLLDQRLLPAVERQLALREWPDVVAAIRTMAIRGAPAIGIAGAMGVALAARRALTRGDEGLVAEIRRAGAELRAARPTAVNLAWAVDAQLRIVAGHDGPAERLVTALEEAARALHRDEVARCRRIGAAGATLIGRGARVLTHCNAGGLATGGYGTALGVIHAAHAADPTLRAVVNETRPLLQGARLTAWELARSGIAFVLIADGAAAAMMAAGRVSHVVVGADRIAANGDVVNKIGTYSVALAARAHGIPFLVAAPTSTLDLSLASGEQIPIEERAGSELLDVQLLGRAGALAGASTANPAFDVTPAHLVNAIITERGVHRPPYDRTLAAA